MVCLSVAKNEFIQLVCVSLLLSYSSWLFTLGFFPQKSWNLDRSNWGHFSVLTGSGDFTQGDAASPKYKGVVSRLVLFVVDGMRRDHARNLTSLNRERLRLKFNTGVFKVSAKAEAPTVTMPRIKAMATGDVPAFVDVFGNMDAEQFNGDSLIDQWHFANRNVTMFGDETWTRLWGSRFLRSDPVTFFVNEHVQVDLNVSRHLTSELRKKDWQVMILHFGGLDHIGHLYGPFSSLVPRKLREMDGCIDQVLEGLVLRRRRSDWMLVVTSDHGQADSGGHGGPTENEVLTPLIFVSPLIGNSSKVNEDFAREVKQIDMTSTLALLTGVPIPAANSGVVIIELLETIVKPLSNILQLLSFASQQLKRVLEELSPISVSAVLTIEQAVQMHQKWIRNYPALDNSNITAEFRRNAYNKVRYEYVSALKGASDVIAKSVTEFETILVYTSFILIWFVFGCVLLIPCMNKITPMTKTVHENHKGFNVAEIVTSASTTVILCVFMMSSSAFVALLSLTGVKMPKSRLCFVICTFLGLVSFSVLLVSLVRDMFVRVSSLRLPPKTLLLMMVHGALMTSSSFIEEEHQIVYFYTTTVLLLIFMHRLSQCVQTAYAKKADSIDNRLESNLDFIPIPVKGIFSVDVKLSLVGVVLARNLRSWNQTGDKWLSYPDMGDWVLADENALILGSLYPLLSIAAVVLIVFDTRSVVISLVSPIAFCLVLGYHASAFKIATMSLLDMEDHGIFYATSLRTFCFMSILTCVFFCSLRFNSWSSFAMFLQTLLPIYCLLLQSPRDFIVAVLILCLTYILKRVILSSHLTLTDWMFVLNLLARFSYFALGNSNSFTTVDIQTAYTGLSHHNLPVVAFHLFLVMFTGPLLIYSQLSPVLWTKYKYDDWFSSLISSVLLYRCVTCVVVLSCSWAMRFHIMTWTVFSPKVIFELGWTLFDILLCLALYCSSFLFEAFADVSQ